MAQLHKKQIEVYLLKFTCYIGKIWLNYLEVKGSTLFLLGKALFSH